MIENKTTERLLNGETFTHRGKGNSMVPKIKSRQPVRLKPITWQEVKKGDMVFCKVGKYRFIHLVKGKNDKRGVLIGNNHGHVNGWTRKVYGIVVEVLPMGYKEEGKI